MKNLNGEETLWVVLPILLVVAILIASIIILPKTQVENRSKAAAPTAVPTMVIIPTATQAPTPEVICSSLYSPVCSQSGVTYASACEANLAGVTDFIKGACPKAKITPKPSPKILPTTN